MDDSAIEVPAPKNAWLQKVWLGLVFLFGLSLLTSKSGLTLFGPILILWSFFDRTQRSRWIQSRRVLLIISLFPLAFIISFFSIGGSASAYKVLISWPWPLLAAFFYYLSNNQKGIKFMLLGLVAGLILATCYSIFLFSQNTFQTAGIAFLSDNYRIRSFWDIGRWGFFSGLSVLILFLTLNDSSSDRIKKPLFVIFLTVFLAFILSNARAPFMAIFIIIIFFSLTSLRIFKSTLVLLLISVCFLALNPAFYDRIKSAFAVSIQSENITSKHISNSSRLYMWKVGIDFFKEHPVLGTGFESTAQPLEAFLTQKNTEYLNSRGQTEFSVTDQHSSYLTNLVQMGCIFFIICWGMCFFIFFKYLFKFIKHQAFVTGICLAGLAYCFFVFIVYSGFNSYESIAFFAFLSLVREPSQTVKILA